MASESQNSVMYIFGDGRHGHEIVKSMCSYMEKKDKCAKCFVVVVDKSFEKQMEDVKHRRCDIEAIDLSKLKQSPDELDRLMKKHKTNWLLMTPSGDSYNSLDQLKMTMEVFKKNGGQNVIMTSLAKCDDSNEPILKERHQAEQMVKQQFPKGNTILRVQLPMLDLDFFAEGVKRERKWMLPTGNCNFSPVSARRDVACCIGHIIMEHQRFVGKVFTLTNREKINGQRLAQMTGSAFNEDVQFQNISMEETCKILDSYMHGGEQMEGQEKGRKPLRRQLLNRTERDTLLAMFRMIQQNKYDFTTDDVKKITHMDPMSMEEFLRKRESNLRGSQ